MRRLDRQIARAFDERLSAHDQRWGAIEVLASSASPRSYTPSLRPILPALQEILEIVNALDHADGEANDGRTDGLVQAETLMHAEDAYAALGAALADFRRAVRESNITHRAEREAVERGHA